MSEAREKLELIAQNAFDDSDHSDFEHRGRNIVDALLADRDLLLEALGGDEMASQEHFRGDEVVAYSFPIGGD